MMQYIYKYQSPLGGITMASNGEAVTGLWFDGQKYFGSTLSVEREERLLPEFGQATEWLDTYFGGKNPNFMPPLAFPSTPFRMAVWKILLGIPYGHTMSYGEIAAVMARQGGTGHGSARAVGSAVGHNPISLIIPCHRVVGADGSLTGYAGGVDKKARLLAMERVGKGGVLGKK